MTDKSSMNDPDQDHTRHPVEVLAEEFSLRLRSGERPTIDEYAENYAEHADLIRSVFPSIAMFERVVQHEEVGSPGHSAPSQNNISLPVPASFGDYRILREIGRGGMGMVFEAVQQSLNRHVALKVIHAMISDNPEHRARFRHEAEAVASLHHTNIVPVYGVGEDHGLQYYAMQLIDGVTLQDLVQCFRAGNAHNCSLSRSNSLDVSGISQIQFGLADAAKMLLQSSGACSSRNATTLHALSREQPSLLDASGYDVRSATNSTVPLVESRIPNDSSASNHSVTLQQASDSVVKSPFTGTSSPLTPAYYRNVATIMEHAANALDYAHRQHVLHRDIKPANLLLDREGTIWVTDFGLAKRTNLDAVTQTGQVLGTMRYMAPEQFLGKCDSRTDIYSLGLTLYELLTLRPAIEFPQQRFLDPERHSTIAPIRSINPSVPVDLQTIAMKACAYSADDRYQTASDFEEDLRRFLEDRPILARRASTFEKLTRWARRNPAIATLASCTSILLLAITGLLAVWNHQQNLAFREIEVQFLRAESNLQDKSVALEKVQREYSRAEANLELSLRAFDRITDNIASRGNVLALGVDLDDVDASELAGASLSQADVSLLESLLEFFDQFSARNEKDLRVETAQALQHVADIQHRIGKLQDAEKSYQKALNAFLSLRNQFPHRPDVLLSALSIYQELILISAKRMQLQRVPILLQEAKSLLKSEPDLAQSDDGRFALAKILNTIGTLGSKFNREARMRPNSSPLGRWLNNSDGPPPMQIARLQREAEFNEEALGILKSLSENSPHNVAYNLSLARAYRDQFRIARLKNDMNHADEAMRRAVDILENLCKSHSRSAPFLFELADTLGTASGARPIDVQRLQRALGICDEILKEQSDAPEYRALKASTMVKLALANQISATRSPRSEEMLREAISIQRELANRYADISVYSLALAQSWVFLSEVELSLRKPAEARDAISQAIQLAEAFQKKNGNSALPKPYLERLRERRTNIENRFQEGK